MDRLEQVKEALAAMILPWICERTGVSRADVESVLEAEMAFWQAHPRGIKLLFGADCEDDPDAG